MTILNIPAAIYLYDEGIKDISFREIKGFIAKHFGKVKIHLVKLKEKVVETRGLLFDFIATQKAFERLKYSKIQNTCHIILTDKLFATFNEDKCPHIRASIYGLPCVISTSGIVEGPAKPKEYYLYKQKYTQLGIWDIEEVKVKKKFKGRFIDYQDTRLTEVVKGYIAQALFFYITGNPFCKQKVCRLYNSHWQEDLIYSQIKSSKFCAEHKKDLEKIKDFT